MLFFWTVKPCGLVERYRRFGETYGLKLQGLKGHNRLYRHDNPNLTYAWKTHRIRATLELLNLLQGTFLLCMNPSHGQDRFLSVRCWHGYLSVLGFADFSYKSNTAQLFTAFLPIWVLICTGDGSVCTFFMLLRKKTKFNDTNKTVLSWSRLSV